MGYSSHSFEHGKVLYASELNNLANGIEDIYETLGYENQAIIDASKATSVNFTKSDGYYASEHSSSGYGTLLAGDARFGYSSVIELKAGETIIIHSSFNHNVAGLIQTDASGNPIGTKAIWTGVPADNEYVTATRHYTAEVDMYCRACNRYDYVPESEWTIYIGGADAITVEKALRPAIQASGGSVSRPNEPRKAVVCFTFDDGNASDDTAYSILKERGMVCSFALPTTASGRYEKYLQYQKEGFEIVSHSTDANTMSSNSTAVATIESKFKNSKKALEQAGFNITAWVTPSSQLHDDYIPALRKYYDLGFTVYVGDWDEDANGSKVPYNTLTDDLHKLWRVSMESTSVDRVKLAIDEAVANTGYLNFYAHGFGSGSNKLSQDNFKAILDYVKAYVDAGQCIVTAVTEGYIHYYTLRHCDLVGLLNNE